MISVSREGNVLVATLSRPPVNALNAEMVASLDAMLNQVEESGDISVLHIRSDQKVFCAGADLALMSSCFSTPQGPDEMVEVVRDLQRLFDRIDAAPVVTVAEIGTTAMGGGMELALACDVRIAAFEAKLGLTEIRLGLLPAGGGTQRLTRLCGRGIASRLILSGEVVGGQEAERLGLVQWASPRAELGSLTRDIISRFAAMPRTAIALNKACIALTGAPDRAGFSEEITATRRLYDDPESRRRVKEFMSKSKAA